MVNNKEGNIGGEQSGGDAGQWGDLENMPFAGVVKNAGDIKDSYMVNDRGHMEISVENNDGQWGHADLPEGVRDEQDLREYLEQQEAYAREAAAKAEASRKPVDVADGYMVNNRGQKEAHYRDSKGVWHQEEVPDGVRDIQDYIEYREQMAAREAEAEQNGASSETEAGEVPADAKEQQSEVQPDAQVDEISAEDEEQPEAEAGEVPADAKERQSEVQPEVQAEAGAEETPEERLARIKAENAGRRKYNGERPLEEQYPRLPDESDAAYEARLNDIDLKEAEALEKIRKAEADRAAAEAEAAERRLNESDQGRAAARFREYIDSKTRTAENPDGIYTEEEAQHMIERRVATLRNQYEHADEIATWESLLAERDAVNEAESQAANEAELQAANEAELQAAMEAELQAAREAELQAAIEAEEAEKARRRQELEEELRRMPLTAINADRTVDAQELARDMAEQRIQDEIGAKKGLGKFVANLWKGTLFNKYFTEKYRKEAYADILTRQADGEVEGVDTGERNAAKARRMEQWQTENSSITERFVQAAVSEFSDIYVHKDEKMTPADEALTNSVKDLISRYATERLENGKTLDDLNAEYEEQFKRLSHDSNDASGANRVMMDNYMEVAKKARGLVEHELSIDLVMEGFRVYNADVRDGVKTQAHRDNIDKAIEWCESHAPKGFPSTEVIAAAVGCAASLFQTGASTVGRLAGPVGGIAASSVIAGLRERNRVAGDRARLWRDQANGLTRGDTKYDRQIGGTIYEMRSAQSLTEDLRTAMDGGNREDIIRRIAEARVRADVSELNSVDLISYSDAKERGNERLALDTAVAEAMASLTPEERNNVVEMRKAVQAEIANDMNGKEKEYHKVRAKRVAGRMLKTAAIGAVTFLASQEIQAIFDENKIGILEKMGVVKRANADDAKETLAARALGKGERLISKNRTEIVQLDNVAEERIDFLESQGYEVTKNAPVTTETESLVEIDAKNFEGTTRVTRVGWANNGTAAYDGNELRVYYGENGGFVSGMQGNSTLPDGTVIDYAKAVSEGKIKAFLTVSEDLQSTPIEIPITGVNDIGLEFADDVVKQFTENGSFSGKFFEVVYDAGVNADGVQQIIPMATAVGNGTKDTLATIVTQVTTSPATYTAIKSVNIAETTQVVRDLDLSGWALPISGRTNLKRASEPERPTNEQPTPANGQPTPANGQPAPANEQPAPANTEPAPANTQPAPANEQSDNGQPANAQPANTQPAPGNAQPANTEPAPANAQPAPANTQPQLSGEQEGENEKIDRETMEQKLKANIGLVGGEEGYKIMTGQVSYATEEERERAYEAWWNSIPEQNQNDSIRAIPDPAGHYLVPTDTHVREWLIRTGRKSA